MYSFFDKVEMTSFHKEVAEALKDLYTEKIKSIENENDKDKHVTEDNKNVNNNVRDKIDKIEQTVNNKDTDKNDEAPWTGENDPWGRNNVSKTPDKQNFEISN